MFDWVINTSLLDLHLTLKKTTRKIKGPVKPQKRRTYWQQFYLKTRTETETCDSM